LFGAFSGTARQSDFPAPCMRRLPLWVPPPARRFLTAAGITGTSWSPCIEFPCMHGVYDPAEPKQSPAMTILSVLPSVSPDNLGAPVRGFRGSIPSLHVPLSTLHAAPCDASRMTRGQDDSLLLSCMTLSFTTRRRFNQTHQAVPPNTAYFFQPGFSDTDQSQLWGGQSCRAILPADRLSSRSSRLERRLRPRLAAPRRKSMRYWALSPVLVG
jgi:hypothetical protein